MIADGRGTLRALGIGHVGLALVMAASPRLFHRYLARYGAPNEHFIRDIATFDGTLGCALWYAAGRREWRRPVLGVALMQNGLHLLHHVRQRRTASSPAAGAADIGALLALEGVFAATLWRGRTATRDDARRGAARA